MEQRYNRSGVDSTRLRHTEDLTVAVRYRRDLRLIGELPHPVGSDFRDLPLIRMAAASDRDVPGAAASAQDNSASVSLQGKRVVICEDEGITQLQLRRVLTRAGLDVCGAATNGRQGLEIVMKEQPDIVLMDIHMPVMDGLEATRLILATCSVCIVMLTAFSDADYIERAEALGVAGYVLKPVTSETLMPQVRKAYAAFLERSE